MRKTKNITQKSILLITTFISSLLIGSSASKAFIPYVYKPNPQTLKSTSLSIGRTATQLLQLGQPIEAERLAKLEAEQAERRAARRAKREAEQAEALKRAQEEALKGPPPEAEAKAPEPSAREAKRGAKEAKRGAKQSAKASSS